MQEMKLLNEELTGECLLGSVAQASSPAGTDRGCVADQPQCTE
jgi:hypothetical protein